MVYYTSDIHGLRRSLLRLVSATSTNWGFVPGTTTGQPDVVCSPMKQAHLGQTIKAAGTAPQGPGIAQLL
jgi:hypothetical protein